MADIERRKGQTEIGAQKIKAYLGDKINMTINESTKFWEKKDLAGQERK